MFCYLFFVVWLAGASAQTISLGLREYETQEGQVFLLTKEALVDGDSTQFSLDMSPSAESTLPYAAGVATDATVSAFLTTPSSIFRATFKYGPSTVLAFSQLSVEGATLCGNNVYFREVPSSCSSLEVAFASCSREYCGLHGKLSDGSAVFVKLVHGAKPACTTVVKLNTTRGWHAVCTNDAYELSPRDQGFVYHVGSDLQHSIFFPPRTTTGTEEFIMVTVSLVALMLWASQSSRLLRRASATDDDTKIHQVGVATLVSDVMFTLSFTATYAVSRIGVTIMPPQVSVEFEWAEHAVLGLFVVLTAFSPAITFALLQTLPSDDSELRNQKLVTLSRALIETTLMTILFYFMPNMVGEALRETFGMFLGIAICVILARDVSIHTANICSQRCNLATRILFWTFVIGWCLCQLFLVIVSMLAPVFVESAGISNSNAIYVAIIVAFGSAGLGTFVQDENIHKSE